MAAELPLILVLAFNCFKYVLFDCNDTSVDNIDLTKIPVRLYGIKALYRNTEMIRRITTTITGRNVLTFITRKCWPQVDLVGK